MRLFLASSAGQSISLFEKEFFRLKGKKVAFIANASDQKTKKSWIYLDKKSLWDCGAKITNVDLRKIKDRSLFERLSKADVIFVAGGNVFYLLEIMQKSGFDKIIAKLLDSGIAYIGSSAGSCIAAHDITPVQVMDESDKATLKSYKALGLTKTLVLPHFNREKYRLEIIEIKKKYGKRYTLQTLNDNQALVIKGNKSKIVTQY